MYNNFNNLLAKMSIIIFLFRNEKIKLQSNPTEKLSYLFDKFCDKMQIKKDEINFLCNGQNLDPQTTVDQIPLTVDKEKLITVLEQTFEDDSKPVIIKSKEIICPKCKESASISINDSYKIEITNCKNGHITDNLLLSEFEKTQNIDISKIICDKCKEKNMGNVFNKEFYRCINCNMNLCPLCKKTRDYSNHIFINYENKNFICEEHGEPYISYCNDCFKNLCYTCEEKHNNHSITDFKKLRMNKDELEKEISNLREFINKAKIIVDEEIKNYKEKWNKVINNYEIIYKIKKDLFELMENKERNYQKLKNQEFIIKKYEQDFNHIIKNINERYINILKIYERMENKDIITKGECKNAIIIKYKIDNKINNIRIFGEVFVSNNKDNCKIKYGYTEYKLTEYFKINNPENNILEIILTGINNITNASYMFYDCSSLIALPDISEWNTINVTNISYMFEYCTSLETLPDISKWNTINITDMSYLFAHCSSLKSLPDISKWNLTNITDKGYMFIGCSPSLNIPKGFEK